ncbi:MAG: hypothetical protein HY852_17410 [Bradyrhizobium sp.]|uniref:hypothetical protein n=1 Tax=Bradyrhizobium sp. TaxID=376 RepID=UPI0025BF6DAF|nr:hypothetical protein [Bradyrhizobium sp.]MBI5263589.1 hypothetical protein [Bradyrhizobium sp.]
MSSTDIPAVNESGLDQLLKPILDSAAQYLIRLAEPGLEFVPEKLRRPLFVVHQTLSGELRALLELRTVYGDMIVCRIAAARHPWEQGELTHYQHLRLVWSHFLRLHSTFEHKLAELGQYHREALELFSADIEPMDADAYPGQAGIVSGETATCRERQTDRWYEVAPKPEQSAIFPQMRVASDWPDGLSPFADHYDGARRELLSEIDTTAEMVGAAIAGFLVCHGRALLDVIERYNNMLTNFQKSRTD